MRMMPLFAIVAALTATTAALASEDEGCTKASNEERMSSDQIKAKLGEAGYRVSKVEFEDGCAEAKVEDKEGKRHELKLDPKSGAEVERED